MTTATRSRNLRSTGRRHAVDGPSAADPTGLPNPVDAVYVTYRWVGVGRSLGHPAHSTQPGRA